jgi:hypothetical protein
LEGNYSEISYKLDFLLSGLAPVLCNAVPQLEDLILISRKEMKRAVSTLDSMQWTKYGNESGTTILL